MTESLEISKQENMLSRLVKLTSLVNGFSKVKFKEENDRELPFGFMLITLMASCGLSPYESFKRLRFTPVLPFIKNESNEIVRQVEVLNKDPLTSMLKRAEQTGSKVYGEFLRGYVSTVNSGGEVTSYLKSKLRSVFEIQAAAAVRSIERLETLVEAFTVMLLVLLCSFILLTVMSSSDILSSSLGVSFGWQSLTTIIVFVVMPLGSLLFMYLANRMQKSTLLNLNAIYHKAIPTTLGCFVVLILAILVQPVQDIVKMIGEPIFATVLLVAISILPMISYRRMIGLNMKAEEATPSFLRDICESRKTGVSPEKSIVQAATHKGYGSFTEVLKRIIDQLEWGMPLRSIFRDVSERIRSWPVLANFYILIETMEVGGGSPEALELLADYSEKIRDVEKNKRAMLKPYLIMPFIWSVLMIVTFTFTFLVMAQIPAMLQPGTQLTYVQPQLNLYSSAMIFQCWLSGFFTGKVTTGTFASGFEFSMILAVVALLSFLFSQNIMSLFIGV